MRRSEKEIRGRIERLKKQGCPNELFRYTKCTNWVKNKIRMLEWVLKEYDE